MPKKAIRSLLVAFVFALVPTVAFAGGPPEDPGPPPDCGPGESGFDEYGYNYCANVFVGDADGVDRSLDDTVWGDTTYDEDLLVMKWSGGWDDARFHDEAWDETAWENNVWNGKSPDASGETAQYKIEYDTSCEPNCIWDTFEIIQSQGTVEGDGNVEHYQDVLVTPNGYGDGGE